MDTRKRGSSNPLSWVLIAIATVALVGGIVYDVAREGEDPSLMGLYLAAIAMGLLGMMLGLREKGGSGGDGG